MPPRPLLITGFEAYGGERSNPAAEVALALEGGSVDGVPVVAAVLPVVLEGLFSRVEALLDEHDPLIVLGVGLHRSAHTLRFERVGLNVADFGIADNAGARLVNEPLDAAGGPALFSTLPVHRIVAAALEAGLPAVVSSSAGTYLCNAALYAFLAAANARPSATRCGFMHVPFTPRQAAAHIARIESGETEAGSDGGTIASMSLETMIVGARIALEVSLAATRDEAG